MGSLLLIFDLSIGGLPNLAVAVILEWAFEQLKAAGSTERLLKYRLGKKEEKK
jgi:hypothetical protein